MAKKGENVKAVVDTRYTTSDDGKYDDVNEAIINEAFIHLDEILPFSMGRDEEVYMYYSTSTRYAYMGQQNMINAMLTNKEMYEDFKKVVDNVHELREVNKDEHE